jgi:hypothetical protein
MEEKMLEKKLFTLNGKEYFGDVRVENEKVVITRAIIVKEDLKETLKHWFMERNLDNLMELEVSGLATLSVQSWTKADKLLIKSISAQVDFAMIKAVPELQNEAIRNV